ncbi:flagellar biosynthesis protein FlhB [Salinisphaera hydrothermalis]|uniref:Flagellar biosynthetic protein FlhB n=1 Tax=Salinisphaera hydrothermalis (strain C41B8) TaxID=1304275 RepID=A0A084IMV7_SALHC|nr:flagellar biosynthesis protein FlhB [Salinisphaera hydrothermalis]KEZ78041.1 flagellar biosynthetic protein FlhB [Salinisphaera hydrothermalis C41B8]
MAEDSDEEKTEDPTPQRLEKAREEGQVARSRELTTFLMLVTAIAGLWMTSGWFVDAVLTVGRTGFGFGPGVADDPSRMMSHIVGQLFTIARGIAPLLGLLVIMALVAPNLLGGLVISSKSLKVDFNRLNPIKGLGRVFSANAAAELGKAVAKSVLIGSVAAGFIYAHLGEMIGLAGQDPATAIVHALRLVIFCCALMVLAFVVVVAIDVPFQIWSHHKKLRMSLKDIKDEHKENEGDPQIKARIREQQQRMARSRMMAAVPDADVVVTNPSHYAVALAYDGERMGAPRVVAKGADEVAARIRELAAEHRIPRLAAPPLARALYRHADLDAEIPAALYTAVAEVLAWVYQLDRARRDGGPAPDTPRDIEIPPELAVPAAQDATS